MNQWLEKYEPDVTQMVQTANGAGVTISFLFEESFRGQELRLSSAQGIREDLPVPMPASEIPDAPLQVPGEPGEIPAG